MSLPPCKSGEGHCPDPEFCQQGYDCETDHMIADAERERDRWYGMSPRPGAITYTVPEPPLAPPPDTPESMRADDE